MAAGRETAKAGRKRARELKVLRWKQHSRALPFFFPFVVRPLVAGAWLIFWPENPGLYVLPCRFVAASAVNGWSRCRSGPNENLKVFGLVWFLACVGVLCAGVCMGRLADTLPCSDDIRWCGLSCVVAVVVVVVLKVGSALQKKKMFWLLWTVLLCRCSQTAGHTNAFVLEGNTILAPFWRVLKRKVPIQSRICTARALFFFFLGFFFLLFFLFQPN